MEYPKITIIILHWKHVSDTMHCLESLQKCTYPNFQVILLLNGCTLEDQINLENTIGKTLKQNVVQNWKVSILSYYVHWAQARVCLDRFLLRRKIKYKTQLNSKD